MKPFLQGKKSVALESLKPPVHGGTASPHLEKLHGTASGITAGAGTQVEVVREGDKVVRLIVNCACGERVEIDCLYSAGR